MRRLKPIKDLKEYIEILDELDDMEKKGLEDTRGFRDLKKLIRKYEKPFIEENETPIEKPDE